VFLNNYLIHTIRKKAKAALFCLKKLNSHMSVKEVPPRRTKKMSIELAFKTTSDLEAHKKQLVAQLTTVKMELSKRSKLDAAVKRLAISNSDITQGKEQLREIYEMHEAAMVEHERAMRHLSWCAEELDLARANLRSSIRRKRRANKSLKRLRNDYPPLPSSPVSEAIWCPKDDEIAYNPSLKQYENRCYSPVSQCDTFLDAGVEIQQSAEATNTCDVWCEVCCQCPHSPQPVAQKNDVLNSPPQIYRMSGEKDDDYWFQEWAAGMPEIDDEEEPPKTEKEIDEEEEKRAIWEDMRMIKSLERGDRRRNR
jgi:hypothetical protein